MKFAVKAAAMDRVSKRQVGKIRTEIIDTCKNELFMDVQKTYDIERKYESFWNDLNPYSEEIVKVLSVKKY